MYSNYTFIGSALRTRGLSATCITGEIRNDKDLQVRVMNGEFHYIVFIGGPGATSHKPALEANGSPTSLCRVVHLVAFMVDEAHCITEW